MSTIKNFVKMILQLRKEEKYVPIEHKVDAKRQFENKVALISGGTGGIGLSIAKSLLESGCKVIVAGTNIKKLDLIKKENPSFETIVMNYSNANEIDKEFSNAVSIFGEIDIFISSAGVHTENVDFWTMNPKEFQRILNINLEGTYFACQAAGRYMKEKGIKGHILLISSSRGSEPAWSPYGISKWGIKGLTQGLAQVLTPYGIIVNAIAPGTTATPLVGYKENDYIYTNENHENRLIMPDEVASLAKYLVSDSANMIAGETIHISGGRGIFDIR